MRGVPGTTPQLATLAGLAGSVVVASALFVAACGYDVHAPPDAGVDAPPAPCLDPDGDGWGTGEGCLGFDCQPDDPRAHECVCDERGVGTGCPCVGGDAPEICYGGPPGTASVGDCRVGLRRCDDLHWTACQDEVVPSAEVCDGRDNDCDGQTDEDMTGACGDCDPSCVLLRWGVGGEDFPTDVAPALRVRDDGAATVASGPGERRGVSMIPIDGGQPGCRYAFGRLGIGALVPRDSAALFEVRGADSEALLPAASWRTVTRLPDGEDASQLLRAGEEHLLLQLRMTLAASGDAEPVVEWVTLERRPGTCTP